MQKQEVSSNKIIVEANGVLLSLKKDSGKVKFQMTWDEDAMTQVGWGGMLYKWTKTTKDLTEMTDQNDQGSKMALVCFGKSWYRLSSA